MTGDPTFETAIYRAAVTGIAVFTAACGVALVLAVKELKR